MRLECLAGLVVLSVVVGCGAQGAGAGGGSSSAGGASSSSSSSSSTASAGGAGGAGGGIGEPSQVFPAPHGAVPTVLSSGGQVLGTPRVHPVFFAGDDAAIETSLLEFYTKLGPSSYWSEAVGEYGVGALSVAPAIHVSDPAPTSITFAEIDAWLTGKLDANDPVFAGWDGSSILAIHFPAATKIDIGGTKSCVAFGGYHENVLLDGAHGAKSVPYVVLPRCTSGGHSTLDTLTASAAHEIIEAATDPLPLVAPAFDALDPEHAFWAEPGGGAEIGDMCSATQSSYYVDSALGAFVPRMWSNVAAQKGHDPCVPAPSGAPYFNAAPVLLDDVPYKLTSGETVKAKGVHVAVGDTKVVEVDLFSDADVGPWTVKALDVATLYNLPPTLDLHFDQSTGQNGQKLHLSIHPTKASSTGTEAFVLVSERGGVQHAWVGLVGN